VSLFRVPNLGDQAPSGQLSSRSANARQPISNQSAINQQSTSNQSATSHQSIKQ
jgi:hypothetical protein